MTVATGFRFRALTPDQDRAIAAAFVKGARASDLAAAYDVSPRTIYHAVERAERPQHHIVIAGYQATFELEDGIPVQVTAWVPA